MAGNLKMNGAGKAALFLMVMGEEFTANVFKHLEEKEVKAIGEEMANIKNMGPGSISSVLNEFLEMIKGGNLLGGSGDRFFERSLSRAFPSSMASVLLNDVRNWREKDYFKKLESLGPEMLVNFISSEHPQTIALILSNLSTELAAGALKLLPENIQSEVIVRIAKLDSVPADIIMEIQEILAEQIAGLGNAPKRGGGAESAAEILNQMDRKTEKAILERIEEDEEELAEAIRQSMFVFEDLIGLDDRSIRSLLKEITNEELLLSLKTASDPLKEKILGNLSQRAGKMLKEDMEVIGPVKLVEVERAQLSIINAARRLEEEGSIFMGGKGGEDIIV